MRLLALGLVFMLTAQVMTAFVSPYVCLDVNPNLLPCDFQWVTGEDMINGEFASGTLENPFNDIKGSRSVTIIYQLMGCIPFKMPYALPNCKTEDFHDHLVQIRRIIPFALSNSEDRHYPRDILSHLKTIRIWSEDEDRDSSNHIIDDSNSLIPVKLMKKWKKVRLENLLRKSQEEKTDNVERRISMFPSISKDFPVKNSAELTKPEYWNQVDSDIGQQKTRRQSRSDLTKWGIEFPYGEAVPFNPEKHWMLLHHRPEANVDQSTIPELENESDSMPKMLKKRVIEFPYFEKHGMLLNKLERHHKISPLTFSRLKMLNSRDRTNSPLSRYAAVHSQNN